MENTTINTELINSIIREKMILATGAGVIPIPLVDLLAVSAIQVSMVRQISRAYDVNYKESEGKTLITALTGASLARLGGSLIKSIPGVGSFIGGATTAVLSAASTYAVGEVFKEHFGSGGTFMDFDIKSFKKFYDEKFEKGKDVAKDMNRKNKSKTERSSATTSNHTDPRMKEYKELWDAGVLTEAEYLKHTGQ